MKTLAFDWLILIRAAIAKILLGQYFVHLTVMGLADLVPEGYGFGGGEREAFRWFFAGIVRAGHPGC